MKTFLVWMSFGELTKNRKVVGIIQAETEQGAYLKLGVAPPDIMEEAEFLPNIFVELCETCIISSRHDLIDMCKVELRIGSVLQTENVPERAEAIA